MCPADQTDEKPDDDTAAAGGAEAAQGQNHVVGPLTDDELRAGGMKRTVAYTAIAVSFAMPLVRSSIFGNWQSRASSWSPLPSRLATTMIPHRR